MTQVLQQQGENFTIHRACITFRFTFDSVQGEQTEAGTSPICAALHAKHLDFPFLLLAVQVLLHSPFQAEVGFLCLHFQQGVGLISCARTLHPGISL